MIIIPKLCRFVKGYFEKSEKNYEDERDMIAICAEIWYTLQGAYAERA